MPAYKTGKRTQKYSIEFKTKAVLWSHDPARSCKELAEALDIHPFMLSRWRKECRQLPWSSQGLRVLVSAPHSTVLRSVRIY